MMNSIWVYEIILFIYGCSIAFYIIDLVKSNWKVNKVAFWLLSLAWTLQSIVILYELFYVQSFPIFTLNDGIYMYAWLLLTFSLVMNQVFPVHFMVFFTNLFAFMMFWLAISLHTQTHSFDKGIQLMHEVLIAHISFTIIGYSFLTLSFLLAAMYLIQYRLLKKKKGIKWMWRFGDLGQLDIYSFSTVKLGVPFLFIGLTLGILWGYMSGDVFYWMDPKTIGSIMVLVVYVAYLILRWTRGYTGRTISILNSATFLVLLVNFFLFSVLSNFHF